jgi:DNA-binding GntR family transcriptional regulator
MKSSPSMAQNRPIKEEVFEMLHRRVIAGEYAGGQWLRQEEIASQMNVSMTPVREALDLLVSAGLAERVPYRGVRVRELSQDEITEAYGLRLLLESVAARAAATRITQAQVQDLSRIVDDLESHVTLNDMSHARQLSREFHLSIVRATGDALLVKSYSLVVNSFPDWMLYEAMFRHPELLAASLAEEQSDHRAIVFALTNKDAEAAVQKTIRHILHMGRDMEQLLGIPAEKLREKERMVMPLLNERQHGNPPA